MPEFPSTRALLADFIRQEGHTLEGQRARAEMLANFAQRWELGDVQLVDYPEKAGFPEVKPKQCNVVIEIDGQPGGERTLWHGHYDSINPKGHYPDNFYRSEYDLVQSRKNPDICKGCSVYDMMGGIAAMLVAARRIQTMQHPPRNHIRILLVGGEEDQSQGTYAALHSTPSLVRDISSIVSMDIPVGGSLSDPPGIGIGRQGRLGFELRVEGDDRHAGSCTPAIKNRLAATRMGILLAHLPDIKLPEVLQPHFEQFMPSATCVVGGGGGLALPHGMSVPSKGVIPFSVHTSNPGLDPIQVRSLVHQELHNILEREGITGDEVFSLYPEPGRRTEFIPPYHDKPSHPLVQAAASYLAKYIGERPRYYVGHATADEPLLVHATRSMAIQISPRGTKEHHHDERVSIRSIEHEVAPTLVDLANHDGPLR